MKKNCTFFIVYSFKVYWDVFSIKGRFDKLFRKKIYLKPLSRLLQGSKTHPPLGTFSMLFGKVPSTIIQIFGTTRLVLSQYVPSHDLFQ